MSELTEAKGKKKEADSENMDPVHVIRKGAIAASIWQRQSPSGFAYYDYSVILRLLQLRSKALRHRLPNTDSVREQTTISF